MAAHGGRREENGAAAGPLAGAVQWRYVAAVRELQRRTEASAGATAAVVDGAAVGPLTGALVRPRASAPPSSGLAVVCESEPSSRRDGIEQWLGPTFRAISERRPAMLTGGERSRLVPAPLRPFFSLIVLGLESLFLDPIWIESIISFPLSIRDRNFFLFFSPNLDLLARVALIPLLDLKSDH